MASELCPMSDGSSRLFLPQEDQGHVVHDMKSPFNGLVGLTEAMAQITKDAARKAQFLLVHKAAKRCCDRIEQQVSCDKLASGLVDFTATQVDLVAIVSEAVAVLAVARDVQGRPIKADSVELLFTSTLPSASIVASEWHVSQIVYELIFNALKFTDSGTIQVSLQSDVQSFVLTVADSGVGFASETLANLGNAMNRKYKHFRLDLFRESLGLGLACAQEVLRFQGGDLQVTSSTEGSVVRAVFPVNFRVQTIFTQGGPEGFGYLTAQTPETSRFVAQRRGLGLIAQTLLPVHFGLLGIGVQLLAGETKAGPRKQVAVLETCAKRVIEVMTLIRDTCFLEEAEISDNDTADIGAIIDRCVAELSVAFDKKGAPMKKSTVEFSFAKSADLGNVILKQTDSVRLYRVLYQLLDNANKFTKTGFVKVSCQVNTGDCDRPVLVVTVTDTGVGFDSDTQTAELFVPFHRLNADQFYGLGIGLNMVKAFCDKAGIPLHCTSVKGQGTVFSLTMPCALDQSAVTGAVSPADIPKPAEAPAAAPEPAPAPASPPALASAFPPAPLPAAPPAPPASLSPIQPPAPLPVATVPPTSALLPRRLQDRVFGVFFDETDVVTASLYERCVNMREDLALIYEERQIAQDTFALLDLHT